METVRHVALLISCLLVKCDMVVQAVVMGDTLQHVAEEVILIHGVPQDNYSGSVKG